MDMIIEPLKSEIKR